VDGFFKSGIGMVTPREAFFTGGLRKPRAAPGQSLIQADRPAGASGLMPLEMAL
jgi:hypothetical protein